MKAFLGVTVVDGAGTPCSRLDRLVAGLGPTEAALSSEMPVQQLALDDDPSEALVAAAEAAAFWTTGGSSSTWWSLPTGRGW